MLLKLGRDVAPYKTYLMVHILMSLWQHARFQSPASSPASSKLSIAYSARESKSPAVSKNRKILQSLSHRVCMGDGGSG